VGDDGGTTEEGLISPHLVDNVSPQTLPLSLGERWFVASSDQFVIGGSISVKNSIVFIKDITFTPSSKVERG
jgi:hypothetical protein